jgi:hypothetical protein
VVVTTKNFRGVEPDRLVEAFVFARPIEWMDQRYLRWRRAQW